MLSKQVKDRIHHHRLYRRKPSWVRKLWRVFADADLRASSQLFYSLMRDGNGNVLWATRFVPTEVHRKFSRSEELLRPIEEAISRAKHHSEYPVIMERIAEARRELGLNDPSLDPKWVGKSYASQSGKNK